jgi:hypothetical protein
MVVRVAVMTSKMAEPMVMDTDLMTVFLPGGPARWQHDRGTHRAWVRSVV